MPQAEPLICACPHCGTRFRVTEEMLEVADGKVRCGACLSVFRGREHLQGPRAEVERGESAAAKAPVASAAQRRPAPRARSQRRQRRTAAIAAAACIVLGLALVANVLGLQYDAWSQQPTMRSVYASICAVVGCELATLGSLIDVEVQATALTRHGPPQPWMLDVELVNRASFRQPAPTLVVVFSDADGALLEERRFAPEDYLPPGSARLLEPNRPIDVALHLDDPGALATTFAIALL